MNSTQKLFLADCIVKSAEDERRLSPALAGLAGATSPVTWLPLLHGAFGSESFMQGGREQGRSMLEAAGGALGGAGAGGTLGLLATLLSKKPQLAKAIIGGSAAGGAGIGMLAGGAHGGMASARNWNKRLDRQNPISRFLRLPP